MANSPPCQSKKRHNVGCTVACSCFFLTLAIAGCLVALYAPLIVKEVIANLMPIKDPTSLLFGPWQDTEAAGLGVTRKFYFFNLTNPEEVTQYHQPPDFHVVGPYHFREHTYLPRDDIKWKTDASIDFKYLTDLHFVPEMSVDEHTGEQLSLGNYLTLVNFPMLDSMWRLDQLLNSMAEIQNGTILQKYGDQLISDLTCDVMAAKLNDTHAVADTGIFINRTIQEYLHGYDEPIWMLQHELSFIFYNSTADREYTVPTYYRGVFNGTQPAPGPASARYGQRCPMWGNQSVCNNSGSNTSTVQSGQTWRLASQVDVDAGVEVGSVEEYGSLKQVNSYVSWAGQDKMWWWGDDNNGACQTFEGSNGLNGWPGITKDDTPFVFVDALFRKIQLQYVRTHLVGRVPAYRFERSDLERIAGPFNKCYGQQYDGFINLTMAIWAPMYVTDPYFFGADTDGINIDLTAKQEEEEGEGNNKQKKKKQMERISLVNISFDGILINKWKRQHSAQKGDYTTYMSIEPNTGATMEATGFTQANTLMSSMQLAQCRKTYPQGLMPNILGNKNFTFEGKNFTNHSFPSTMVPFSYMRRHAQVPESLNAEIYTRVLRTLGWCKYGGWGLMVFSLIVFLLFTLRSACRLAVQPEEYLSGNILGESTNLNFPQQRRRASRASGKDDNSDGDYWK